MQGLLNFVYLLSWIHRYIKQVYESNIIYKEISSSLVVMAHAFNPSAMEAEAGGFLGT